MIADLDETIRLLLRDELPIKNGEIDIKFDQPKREWSAKLNKPTINFYLYDLRENHVLRQHQWEKMGGGNGSTVARMKRTPFRVDCYYMLTIWAAEPEDCHRLLSRCISVLFRYAVLPEERLVGEMKDQPYDVQTRLASHDKLTNPAEVWSALDNEIRPSISFLVTLAIDPWQVVEGPAVRSYSMQTGTMSEAGQRIDPESTSPGNVTIGGVIRDKDGAPQPGLDVAFKGTGFVDRTDQEGRYRLGSAAPGEYTLVVWPQKGKPKERKINVPPTKDDDYDVTL